MLLFLRAARSDQLQVLAGKYRSAAGSRETSMASITAGAAHAVALGLRGGPRPAVTSLAGTWGRPDCSSTCRVKWIAQQVDDRATPQRLFATARAEAGGSVADDLSSGELFTRASEDIRRRPLPSLMTNLRGNVVRGGR